MILDLSSLAANPDLVRLNPELLQEPAKKETRRKYGNEPTEYAGRQYASAREAKRAQELDLMKRAGEIAGWIPQYPFLLAGGIKYVCDFVVLLPDGTWRAEDVKSPATRRIATYRLKRKLFRAIFHMDIVEI